MSTIYYLLVIERHRIIILSTGFVHLQRDDTVGKIKGECIRCSGLMITHMCIALFSKYFHMHYHTFNSHNKLGSLEKQMLLPES